MKRVLLALLPLLLIALAAPAMARRKLTGNPVKDIKSAIQRTDSTDGVQSAGGSSGTFRDLRRRLLTDLSKPFQDIADVIGDDIDGAIRLSTAVPDLQDGHGQQCWIALRNFSTVAKAHPLPLTGQNATHQQALRLYAIATNRLCADVHCTQMFSDFSSMAQAVASAAVGIIGAGAAKLATPSLQDVCSKIPQVPLVDPLDPVPPAPDIKPVGLGAPAPSPQ